ncbi:peptidase M24, structural domain-containing protein [Powellomyces hirtus]|nr:peptidase M24, structural domain-containing protein [Powellomyces hirtus]
MKAGHTFTIEPMISEGTWHDQQWPDGWTVTTIDGKRSAQFEETLLVTETGCEILKRLRRSILMRNMDLLSTLLLEVLSDPHLVDNCEHPSESATPTIAESFTVDTNSGVGSYIASIGIFMVRPDFNSPTYNIRCGNK